MAPLANCWRSCADCLQYFTNCFLLTKPLKAPIDAKRAEVISSEIAHRVNSLEIDAVSWVNSFSKLLGVKPTSVQVDPENAQLLQVKFSDLSQAQRLRHFLIQPELFNRLFSFPNFSCKSNLPSSLTVTIQRRIPIHLPQDGLNSYFQYGTLRDSQGNPTPFYRGLINDRIIFLGSTLGGPSENSFQYSRL